jgi:hypothetical protein
MIPTSPKHEVLCLVLRLPLSCHAWCRGHCCRTVWVLWLPASRCVGVVAVSVAPRGCCGCWHCAVWVLQLPSSHCMWCCGRCHRAAHGVAGAVITPHMVAWSRSSHSMWCCGHGGRAVWCCGRGGCRRGCRHHRHRIIIVVGGWAVVGPGGRGRLRVHWQR